MDIDRILQELDSIFSGTDSAASNKKRGNESSLVPFRLDILSRKHQKNTYRDIQRWLLDCHGVDVDHTTVFDFVNSCLKE